MIELIADRKRWWQSQIDSKSAAEPQNVNFWKTEIAICDLALEQLRDKPVNCPKCKSNELTPYVHCESCDHQFDERERIVPDIVTYTCEHPIYCVDQAKFIAASKKCRECKSGRCRTSGARESP